MSKTERLDVLVVERGLFASRESARTGIMDGVVLVDGNKSTKPGQAVRADARIELIPGFAPLPYVSRGGLKLEKALQVFAVQPRNRVCLDIGASTGGFTDCLLKNGARKVFAIDVGYGQLDWSLRTDERVVVLERTNARHLTCADLYGDNATNESTLAVMDVSFISLLKVLPAVIQLLVVGESEIVALVKPQFEVGKHLVGKGGVVRDAEAHRAVLSEINKGVGQLGASLKGLTFSPLKGPKGNIEFLAHITTEAESGITDVTKVIESTVNDAHAQLDKLDS